MNKNKRPVSILILACVYIALGAVGFVFHFRELLAGHSDAVWIELTELLAIVAGIFLLLRQNWARWLTLAWIVFHVGLSMMHPGRSLVVHSLLCAVIAWILFRPEAGRWFGKAASSD
jgi:hypothetical protein